MGNSESPTVSVSLCGPTDIPAILARVGIDYVSVHEHRLLAIYHTAIFNITTDPRPLSNTQSIEIECWEAPIPSHADERSPEALLEGFADVFDSVE